MDGKEGPSGQIVSLRAPDDKQSMSLDLMSGASVEEIQASLGGRGRGDMCVAGWVKRDWSGWIWGTEGEGKHTPPALVEGRVGPQ